MKFSAILPLAAIATAVMPSFAAAAGNATISVLTNNVYFLSEILYPNWGQSTDDMCTASFWRVDWIVRSCSLIINFPFSLPLPSRNQGSIDRQL